MNSFALQSRIALPACSRSSAKAFPVTHAALHSSRLSNAGSSLSGQSLLLKARNVRPSISRSSSKAAPLRCQAAAADAEVAKPDEGFAKTAILGAMFAGWYAFNIYFNIFNKQSLGVFPYPVTCTTIQFFVGSLLSITMWTFGIIKKPKIDAALIKSILPLAAVHTLGNMLTNISLGQVAVSFTHTIKAMEPFFSVLLSGLFLGDTPTVPIILSLFPIVGGVAMASVSEATFNWGGFLAAMGSNITFQSRNVFSKKFMGKGKGSLDNINLFSIITIISFFLLAPVALLKEGVRFTPAAMKAIGIVNPNIVFEQIFKAALCFHAYQQVSYMILARVSPVTHSIGNCLKRVIVIVASVIVFQNPMSDQNKIGTAIALAGVFLYSQAKRASNKANATKTA